MAISKELPLVSLIALGERIRSSIEDLYSYRYIVIASTSRASSYIYIVVRLLLLASKSSPIALLLVELERIVLDLIVYSYRTGFD